MQKIKDKAEGFARRVLQDDDKADEFEDMTLEEYAERKRIELTNPANAANKRRPPMARAVPRKTKDEIIQELRDENEELQAVVDDYESRFDAIQDELPSGDEEDEGGDGEDDEDQD